MISCRVATLSELLLLIGHLVVTYNSNNSCLDAAGNRIERIEIYFTYQNTAKFWPCYIVLVLFEVTTAQAVANSKGCVSYEQHVE